MEIFIIGLLGLMVGVMLSFLLRPEDGRVPVNKETENLRLRLVLAQRQNQVAQEQLRDAYAEIRALEDSNEDLKRAISTIGGPDCERSE